MNDIKPSLYTCYRCSINFLTKKCPKCGQKGTPVYDSDLTDRIQNNPTDVNSYFDKIVQKKQKDL